MTQEEINAERERLRAKIAEHQGEIEVLQAMLSVNRKRCKHPNLYATSCMGESGTHCPDCGHGT